MNFYIDKYKKYINYCIIIKRITSSLRTLVKEPEEEPEEEKEEDLVKALSPLLSEADAGFKLRSTLLINQKYIAWIFMSITFFYS